MRKYINYRSLVIVLMMFSAYTIVIRRNDHVPLEAVATAQQGASRLSQLLGGDQTAGFANVLEPRTFRFPDDHGPHSGYRNEWWYFTGNLDGAGGERFGFELTIFRFLLAPGIADDQDSAWRSNQVFIGHFAISDIGHDTFHVAQRYARGSLGLAGAERSPLRLWVEDWSIEAIRVAGATVADGDGVESWHLRAAAGDLALNLRLVALKAPVLNGDDGLSQKSSEAGYAAYYYSVSRLQSDGTLSLAGVDYPVSGLSWLDREWSSSGLAADQAGWDWFGLQLSDGSELMFYDLRKTDGGRDSHSRGTFVDTDGSKIGLSVEDLTIDILDYWNSPAGSRYPAAWHLHSATAGLDLEVRPLMANQELQTAVQYWEGAVEVSGRRRGKPVAGRGYVELTGYVAADVQP